MSDGFARIAGLAGGYVEARILQTAVRLRVFEALRKEDADAAGLAAAIGAEARATGLLLEALAVIGLVDRYGTRYRLNDLSRTYLLSSSPRNFSGMVRFDALAWDAWGKLEDAVRSGRPARPPDMYQTEEAETGIFIEAMDSLVNSRGDAALTADALDLGQARRLLDIGPGPATYPIALCRRYPALRATLYDLPGTLRITQRYVRASDVADRIECVAGDYRTDAIPGGYDVVFLSNIIHGENETTNEDLIRNLSKSLVSGGILVIKDHILGGTPTETAAGTVFSLLMLLTTDGGRCYTLDEIRGWFGRAGLADVSRVELPVPLTSSLVIGRKPL